MWKRLRVPPQNEQGPIGNSRQLPLNHRVVRGRAQKGGLPRTLGSSRFVLNSWGEKPRHTRGWTQPQRSRPISCTFNPLHYAPRHFCSDSADLKRTLKLTREIASPRLTSPQLPAPTNTSAEVTVYSIFVGDLYLQILTELGRFN